MTKEDTRLKKTRDLKDDATLFAQGHAGAADNQPGPASPAHAISAPLPVTRGGGGGASAVTRSESPNHHTRRRRCGSASTAAPPPPPTAAGNRRAPTRASKCRAVPPAARTSRRQRGASCLSSRTGCTAGCARREPLEGTAPRESEGPARGGGRRVDRRARFRRIRGRLLASLVRQLAREHRAGARADGRIPRPAGVRECARIELFCSGDCRICVWIFLRSAQCF